MAKNIDNESTAAENAKLEAIKQIIFGQNMKEYEKEFNEIREYINLNLNAIDKKISEVNAHFEKLNATALQNLSTTDKNINAKIDDTTAQLRNQLNQIEKNLNDKLSALEKSFDAKLQKQETNITTKINQLNEAKVDRKKLGKLLSDIAQKIAE